MSVTDWDDMTLMRAVGEGEMDALAELVHRYQDRALHLAYRMTGDWHLAEDLAQDAFLQVYRAAPRFRPRAKFMTWLYRIVTNLCLDARRRRKHHPNPLPRPEAVPVTSDPPDPVEAAERADKVRRAVQELPDRQRAVLVLHRYERMAYAEIAEITGWTESAVESLLVRAYAGLRKKLSDLVRD